MFESVDLFFNKFNEIRTFMSLFCQFEMHRAVIKTPGKSMYKIVKVI